MTAHGILGESRSWLVEEVVKEMRKEQVNAHPFAHCKKVLLTTLQVGVICIGDQPCARVHVLHLLEGATVEPA